MEETLASGEFIFSKNIRMSASDFSRLAFGRFYDLICQLQFLFKSMEKVGLSNDSDRASETAGTV
ncbi:hypothetical protein GCM10008986_28260 [Salinibacillus aidingensis]|uniref:Uncharacterized protein n=1 Tax=Salinibacillus aidingensis TaxID=237684 RepID=A0ABN1BJS7_9BACI